MLLAAEGMRLAAMTSLTRRLNAICLGASAGTAMIYIVLVYTRLFRNIGWHLFGVHLALALIGAVTGVWGTFRRQPLCLIGLVGGGYFLVIQLLL